MVSDDEKYTKEYFEEEIKSLEGVYYVTFIRNGSEVIKAIQSIEDSYIESKDIIEYSEELDNSTEVGRTLSVIESFYDEDYQVIDHVDNFRSVWKIDELRKRDSLEDLKVLLEPG